MQHHTVQKDIQQTCLLHSDQHKENRKCDDPCHAVGAQDLRQPGAEQIQRRQLEQRESATNAKGCQQLLAQIIRWHSIRNIQVGCGAQRNGNNHKECAGSIIWHICLPSFCVAGLKEKAHVHYLRESSHMEYITDRYKYRTARQRLLKQKINNPEGNVNT